MNPELQKFDDVVASLTAPDQPFALENITIEGVEYRNYSAMPAALGEYFVLMQRHADKDFAVYQQERYTFGEAYARSAEFANGAFNVADVRDGHADVVQHSHRAHRRQRQRQYRGLALADALAQAATVAV